MISRAIVELEIWLWRHSDSHPRLQPIRRGVSRLAIRLETGRWPKRRRVRGL